MQIATVKAIAAAHSVTPENVTNFQATASTQESTAKKRKRNIFSVSTQSLRLGLLEVTIYIAYDIIFQIPSDKNVEEVANTQLENLNQYVSSGYFLQALHDFASCNNGRTLNCTTVELPATLNATAGSAVAENPLVLHPTLAPTNLPLPELVVVLKEKGPLLPVTALVGIVIAVSFVCFAAGALTGKLRVWRQQQRAVRDAATREFCPSMSPPL